MISGVDCRSGVDWSVRDGTELAEHSTSVEHSLWPLQPESSEHPTSTPRGVVGVSYNQPVSEPTEQSKTGGNLVLKPAPSEIADQPRSGEGLSPGMDTMPRPLPVALSSRSHDSRRIHHGWIGRKTRGAVWSLVKLL